MMLDFDVLAGITDSWVPPDLGSTWDPQPKQQLANEVAEQVDELLYGGAAGGGKTEWLINYCAEQCEFYANNRWAIFRRVFPSLSRTVVPRAKELLVNRATWNGQDHTFTFPNGSILELAHLQHADDVYKHQGTQYGGVAFEEITEFLESQYEYLLGRLRAPAEGIRPHAIATTNPGGVGHHWVKRRWISPRPEDLREEDVDERCPCGCGHAVRPEPFEPWHPAPRPDRPKMGTRCFIPARIDDNPALKERDPDYMDRLLGAISNRALRRALAEGDWDAVDQVEGALVTRTLLERYREVPDPSLVVRRTVLAVDTSDGNQEGDEYGIAVVTLGMDGRIRVVRSDGWTGAPRTLAERTVALAHGDGVDVIVIERNHGGKWVPALLRTVDRYLNIKTVWAGQGKLVRWEPVAALFAPPDEDPDELPQACLVGYHEKLEDEMTTFTGAPGERSPNRLDAVVWASMELVPNLGGSRLHAPSGTRQEAANRPARLPQTQRIINRR